MDELCPFVVWAFHEVQCLRAIGAQSWLFILHQNTCLFCRKIYASLRYCMSPC